MEPVVERSLLRIGLASVRNLSTVEDRLNIVEDILSEAQAKHVAIVCFPEAYLPGLRGMDFPVPEPDQKRQQAALDRVSELARRNNVAVVIGMEWRTGGGMLNVAFVVSRDGVVEGYQSKNQIPPPEEPHYVAGSDRRLFQVDGATFGITICHEGWRYPESVRWAAMRGARFVFHPQLTGSDQAGPTLTRWGDPNAPYYEKAMLMRGIENTVYFASVNCAMRFQESATSLIDPEGFCLAHAPYGEQQLLICDIDLDRATGFYARRFDPTTYPVEDTLKTPS